MENSKKHQTETMEESDEIQTAADSTTGKRSWVLIILIIVAIGIALWLVPEQQDPALATSAKKSVPAPELQPVPKPELQTKLESEIKPEPEAEPEPRVEIQAGPGERAREIIARLREEAGNADKAFAEAQRQQEAGHFEDAYLLHFYAGKQGHAEAALILGTQVDPVHFDPGNGVLRQADPGQAYKWYRVAADNGNGEAESRLATLLEEVKKSAAAGDEQAGRLMLQWR